MKKLFLLLVLLLIGLLCSGYSFSKNETVIDLVPFSIFYHTAIVCISLVFFLNRKEYNTMDRTDTVIALTLQLFMWLVIFPAITKFSYRDTVTSTTKIFCIITGIHCALYEVIRYTVQLERFMRPRVRKVFRRR